MGSENGERISRAIKAFVELFFDGFCGARVSAIYAGQEHTTKQSYVTA